MAHPQGCTKCSSAAASEDQDRDEGAQALHRDLCDISQHFLPKLWEDGAADTPLLPEEHPPNPHIPPDTTCASHPLLHCPLSAPPLPVPRTQSPGVLWLLRVGPCYPTVSTALLQPSKALGLPPASDTSHGHCYQVMRTNVCVNSGLQLGFCVYKAELVFLFIF